MRKLMHEPLRIQVQEAHRDQLTAVDDVIRLQAPKHAEPTQLEQRSQADLLETLLNG